MNGIWISAVGWIVSISLSIIGWVITARTAKRNAASERARFDERISLMQDQVDTLKRQVKIAEEVAMVPDWQIEQLNSRRSIIFTIRNGAPFDAYDVRIEYNGDKYIEIGDLTRGAMHTFEFFDAVIMGGVQTDLTITWLDSPDADLRHRTDMAKP